MTGDWGGDRATASHIASAPVECRNGSDKKCATIRGQGVDRASTFSRRQACSHAQPRCRHFAGHRLVPLDVERRTGGSWRGGGRATSRHGAGADELGHGCLFNSGNVAAIKQLVTLERNRINAHGGISGRRLRIEFLDDERDAKQAVANVRTAFGDPDTLAVIGLGNFDRAKEVFTSAVRRSGRAASRSSRTCPSTACSPATPTCSPRAPRRTTSASRSSCSS